MAAVSENLNGLSALYKYDVRKPFLIRSCPTIRVAANRNWTLLTTHNYAKIPMTNHNPATTPRMIQLHVQYPLAQDVSGG
jgi:hypothetical protein